MSALARIFAAPLLWLASFSTIYGLQGALCAAGDPPARAPLVAAWLFALAAQGTVLAALHPRHLSAKPGTLCFVSRASGWMGLVATVWSLAPVVFTSVCN